MKNINNLTPEVTEYLKRLKLTGMLETLFERNKEAIKNKMSYIDFIITMMQDEILRRDQNKFKSKIKKSCIKANKTIEKFNFDFNPKINSHKIKDLLTCDFINKNIFVLFTGPCGTGKSHLAQAIGFAAIQKDVDVLFTTQDKINKELSRAKTTGVFENRIKKFIRAPLLIIDDFGIKPFKDNQEEDFHDIVAERYENLPTIITSNLGFNEWQKIFTNKLLGSAVLDRIRHNAELITLEGESFRGN